MRGKREKREGVKSTSIPFKRQINVPDDVMMSVLVVMEVNIARSVVVDSTYTEEEEEEEEEEEDYIPQPKPQTLRCATNKNLLLLLFFLLFLLLFPSACLFPARDCLRTKQRLVPVLACEDGLKKDMRPCDKAK